MKKYFVLSLYILLLACQPPLETIEVTRVGETAVPFTATSTRTAVQSMSGTLLNIFSTTVIQKPRLPSLTQLAL